MTVSSNQLSRPQRQALAWIQRFGPAVRLNDAWWSPGPHALQSRRINHATVEALVVRGELRYPESVVKNGARWPTKAEIENGIE